MTGTDTAGDDDASVVASFGEIEVATRKAARGVGMSWGMAEEAGMAVRRLEAWGEPVLEAVVQHLRALDGVVDALQPRAPLASLAACDGPLCPFGVGVRLLDEPHPLDDACDGLELPPIAHPVLMAPFLCDAARGGGSIELATPDLALVCGAAGLKREPPPVRSGGRFRVRRVDRPSPERTTAEPRAVPRTVWEAVQRLAARTYVPASDASRLAGAGADLSDND